MSMSEYAGGSIKIVLQLVDLWDLTKMDVPARMRCSAGPQHHSGVSSEAA
jgi:hypothetical protein